jgi:iduronate 2-sulfatase
MKLFLILILSFSFGCVGQAENSKLKNVLLICVDDLRPELKSFGMDYIISPNIDSLAGKGRAFFRHYVNAPSCGPSRFTLLTGRYGNEGNNALFIRAKALKKNPKSHPLSMPGWFKKNGFTTVSIGKVSHHPGGMGGKDWNDKSDLEMPGDWTRHLLPAGKWKHPRGFMHGLADGEIREVRNEMKVLQAVEGPDDNYPDGLTTNETLKELDTLTKSDKPFFLATGIIRPHLPFGAPKKYLDMYNGVKIPEIEANKKPEGKTSWHKSGEFMHYDTWSKDPRNDNEFAMNVRRHYAACVTYADAQIGRILDKLKKAGADKNTIVVIWGDHGWHLGEHKIWGKHCLYERSLRSPLIVYYPGMKQPGKKTDALVETADIFPTLCELTGIPVPDFKHGVSLLPQLEDPEVQGHDAFSYYRMGSSIRNERYRMILHKKGGHVELYDHQSKEKETKNVASSNPEVVKMLKLILQKKMKVRGRR